MRYKLIIAYDGTHYCGWQVQNTGPSIQAIIQKSLETILRHPISLTGSGRTDSGVHAKGQVAHFDSNENFEIPRVLFSLNSLLPPDIRIFSLEQVDPTFHARYSAKEKTYHYHLHLDRVADPILGPYRYHVPFRIDRNQLIEGTKLFLGTHDFTSFANDAGKGCAAHDPIRTLSRFEPIEQQGGIRLELTSDGFLYKMVRNLVGTLLGVASGRFTQEQVAELFAIKDRSKAGNAAPPHALFLMHVQY
jgi:tRNA pseudouridine38-40 synthase